MGTEIVVTNVNYGSIIGMNRKNEEDIINNPEEELEIKKTEILSFLHLEILHQYNYIKLSHENYIKDAKIRKQLKLFVLLM